MLPVHLKKMCICCYRVDGYVNVSEVKLVDSTVQVFHTITDDLSPNLINY